jgi:hypothetical protein
MPCLCCNMDNADANNYRGPDSDSDRDTEEES